MKLLRLSCLGLLLVSQFASAQPGAKTTPSQDATIESEKGTSDQKALLRKPDSLHAYSAKSIDGKLVNISDYEGQLIMIVNVASKCGFTGQYKDLETLFRKYKEKGFVVLGFPSNDFGGQEPGSNEDIKKFCKVNYDVTFPLFEKLPVKGAEKQPLYKYLTEQSGSEFTGEIAWNFVKFLVNGEGKVIGRFGSSTKPLDKKIIAKIEEQLK